MPRSLNFEYILTPDGVKSHQCIVIDDAGYITGIGPAAQKSMDGFLAVPGMVNAHSHAFQRAMMGHAEAAVGKDSFWSWRDYMYRLAQSVDPDDLYAIARCAFADMLRAGFSSVGEFHYLHHLPDGTRGSAMADALIAAARDVGIRLVFLPVYYRSGGFGKAAQPAQARFVHESVDAFAGYLESFAGCAGGIAPHSLRAVSPDELIRLQDVADTIFGAACPIHIHIAEQQAEVRECVAYHGRPPIRVLNDAVSLDARWSLIHATHADIAERSLMLEKRVGLVLCPLTEAYLGDGLFPAAEYASLGGHFAIGSDSNVRIDAIEELRLLEYGQRLQDRKRARLADASGIGQPLWRGAALAGASALGLRAGSIEKGRLADLVVLSRSLPPLAGLAPAQVLDAWLTGGSRENIDAVYVGGEVRVESGRVRGAVEISEDYERCLGRLGKRMRAGAS